jgi:hypothetical protein
VRRSRILLSALALLGLASGCISAEAPVIDEFAPDRSAAEESVPLGGDALAERKSEMRRSLRDLMHFHRTLSSLSGRRDRDGFSNFAGFLDSYLGTHVDPLLAAQWQSRHPEVMALDANLRLMKAEIFIVLRDTRRVQDTIEVITALYAGRENMLVEFPNGEQGTLHEGLQKLQEDKWRG